MNKNLTDEAVASSGYLGRLIGSVLYSIAAQMAWKLARG